MRALLAAKRQGYTVPDAALKSSLAWLANPKQWDQGAKNKMASDLKLAQIQFAVAANDKEVLASVQDPNGAWTIHTGDLPASPITWGSALATALAIQVAPNAKARAWLSQLKPHNTVELAAQYWTFGQDNGLLASQSPSGAWGPTKSSVAEVFDTAVAILALAAHPNPPRQSLLKARTYLKREQLSTGAWPETTRPSGGTSYAHHISTTAWATLALLRLDEIGL